MLTEKEARCDLGCIRRACEADVEFLNRMVTKQCRTIFGDFDVQSLIQLSYLPICQMDIYEEIICFLVLDLFPNSPAIPQHDWLKWIHSLYNLRNCTARNTLFVHMMWWDRTFNRVILRAVMESVFRSDPFLQYIVFVMPQESPPSVVSNDKSLSDVLLRVNQKGHYDNENFEYLYLAIRNRFCTKLKVRRAVEEDNDDLVAIINQQSERPKHLYGDFYISELIAHPQGSERVILVGELKYINDTCTFMLEEHVAFCKNEDGPIGVMIINTQINYAKLNENFELKPFRGLRKLTSRSKEDTETMRESSNYPDAQENVCNSKIYSSPTSTNGNDQGSEKEDDACLKKKPGVHQGFKKLSHIRQVVGEDNSEFLVSSSDSSGLDLEDEDDQDSEDDYDIVNVDENLFIKIDHFLDDILHIGRKHKHISARLKITEEEDSSFISLYEKLKSVDVPSFESSYIVEEQSVESFMGRNAFIIEIFAMDMNFDERYGFDILKATFEVYPDLEYCIISIPSNIRTFPLLDHFVFIPLRTTANYDHCLYILHRNSIRSELTVREADFTDIAQVDTLIRNLPGQRVIAKDFVSIVTYEEETKGRSAYVMVSEEKIVAFLILDENEDFNYIRQNFESFANVTPSPRGFLSATTLQQVVLAPQFQPASRFFMREVLRLSMTHEIFWPYLIHNYKTPALGRNIMSMIAEFLPLVPKHLMDYNPEHFDTYLLARHPMPQRMEETAQMSMSYINIPVCSFPKIQVNMNIVIVGASNLAFDFLEALLFGPSSAYLTFNNITLLSKHGLPFVQDSLKAADTMLVTHDHTDRRIFNTTPFQAYINVVSDTMIKIRRADKEVVVNGNKTLAYDLLFLFCGVQYQHPEYMKELIGKGKPGSECRHTHNSLFSSSSTDNISIPRRPYNLFIINDIIDANMSLNSLQGMIDSPKYLIIVYGTTLDAYGCIQALLEFGVPGHCIAFVEPFPSLEDSVQQVSFFNNEYVDETVRHKILDKKVQIYSKYYFRSWQYCKKANTIYSVSFLSYYKMLELNCVAMFYYGPKGVDINTFLAISECGLVYNERLIINSYFQTNDTNIFAAGPLAKYSQKYNAAQFDHKHYSSCEIGFRLGELILFNLNPFSNKCSFKNEELYLSGNIAGAFNSYKANASNTRINESSFSIMSIKSILIKCPSDLNIFTKHSDYPFKPKFNLVDVCVLPGGFNYLNISAPGPFIPLELAMTRDDFGRVLITRLNGYFRIHLNDKNIIKAITCLTEEPLDLHNLNCLWGRHEQILNRMLFRYEHNQILDLFAYFRQPWAYAIYHDKFEQLLHKLKEMFDIKVSGDFQGITNKDLIKMMRSRSDITEMLLDRHMTRRRTELVDFKHIVTSELIDFIQQWEEFLPMYAHPNLVRDLLGV